MRVWPTGRGRRAQRRMVRWTRYLQRCDRLVQGQQVRGGIAMWPMRTTPGYFRAEGWDTGARNLSMRHGA